MPNYWMDHVHLVSKDPMKTAEFYEKTFGAKKEDETLPDGRLLLSRILNNDSVTIKISNPRPKPLIANTLPDGCGLEHYGLGTDDIESAVTEMKGQGVKFVQEITALPSGTKISFFVTPDGDLVELLQRPD
ncbi:MAG: VOC family protein [Dehalococcoidales bacterium]